jgi:glycosyltransferase involved in cell wall biosynthesis
MLFVRDLLADQQVCRPAGAPVAPEVSVVLPTYRRNASGLLRRALESVLSQSFTDLELIVVDDGSTDGSRELILAAQAADPRIVYVRHDLNCGLPALRVNEGIELARGRFIAFQFDDDEWLEGALEALVERARAEEEAAVVHGSALLERADGWTRELPDAPVHLLTLSFENRIANNSVLVSRELFDRHGLYDPHVAMRRLCDWDLWLRLARHAPFLGIERRVAVTTVATDAVSLGATVPFELPLFRALSSIPRDSLLTPGRWRDYEVDGARLGGVEVTGAFRERLVRDFIVPYQRRLRHAFPHLAPPPPATGTAPRNLLVTMDSFYGSFEMCAGQYDLLAAARGEAKAHYQPLLQIAPGWERDADFLLLVRTVTPPGLRVQTEALAAGVPAGYYLDDDLLFLHEYGPPFDALGPGGERRADLEAQLAGADAVWLTSPVIAESVLPLNPRIVPHNGAVPESWLPAALLPRGSSGKIRIGYAGDPYRIEEFRRIWSALERISEEFGDRVEFDLWGIDAAALPPLASQVSQRPYTFSYPQFIDRLREARFDILLTPLLTAPRPRLAKAPSQYYHTAVAGALGIFSDVPAYGALLDGLTCLKSANDPDSWHAALRAAVTLPEARFDLLRRRMVEHVRLEFTERAQIHLHEAAVRATEFHAATRERRGVDGRPKVLHLTRGAAALAREYGVDAVDEPEGDAALVFASAGPAWVPREIFDLGLRQVLGAIDGAIDGISRGRIAMIGPARETSRQIEAIEGLYVLHRRGLEADLTLWEGTGEPGYPARCRRTIHELGLESHARVLRLGSWSEALAGADLLLDASGSAEIPAGVREALAAGVLVLSNSPGARELVTDGVTGLLFLGEAPAELAAALEGALGIAPERRAQILQAAYRLARGEFHPQRAASELFALYNQALVEKAPEPAAFTAPVEVPRSGWDRLRERADQLGIYRPLSRLSWTARRKRVLVTYDNDTTSVFLYWRHALPRLEAATGRQWLLRSASEVRPEDLYSFHAVIVVRGISRRSLEILRAARKQGARGIYDLDDNLLLIDQAFPDPANPWRRIFGDARPEVEAMLREADIVKVYAEPAVRSLLPFNPRVTAIRPFQILDRDTLDAVVADRAPITVGFLGSAFKDDDLAPAVRAIVRILDERRPIHFEFLGFLPAALAGRPEVSHVPWRSSYTDYRQTLAALDWDIGLAPLRELEFNRGKNNAKYREYAAAGIAGIYSDAEIYRATVVHRETGLVVPQESEQCWYEAILELAADAGLRGSIRRNAFADVRANYREEEYVARVAALIEGPLPPPGSGGPG